MDGNRRRDTLRWAYVAAIVAWGGWSALAWVLASARAGGWRASVIAVAALLGAGLASSRPRPQWVVAGVAVVVWAVVVWGYVRWAGDATATEMTGPFSASNPFGVLAAVAAVIALVPACTPGRWFVRVGAAAAAAVAGQALVRSGSMGSLIALAFGVVVVVVATWPRRGAAGRRGFGVVVVAAIAAGAIVFGLVASALVSSGSRRVAGTGLGVDPDNHVAEHFEIWAAATGVWRAHPVLGIGPGALPGVTGGIEDARSDLLNSLAETGLVAALAWLIATACAAVAVLVVVVRRGRGPSAAPAALAATTAVLVVYSTVDTTAAWPVVAVVLCAAAGSTVATATRPLDVRT